MELLAPLQDGATASAFAGGWAAIESTLVHPTDAENVVAADRLAAIVACSWPRAELTTLANAHKKHASDQLAEKIAASPDNRTKCLAVIAAMKAICRVV